MARFAVCVSPGTIACRPTKQALSPCTIPFRRLAFLLSLLLPLVTFSVTSFGQGLTGTPAFGTFQNDGIGTVNVSNLNIHFEVPIRSKAGVGLPFYDVLSHDNSVWYGSGGTWTHDPNTDWKDIPNVRPGLPASYTYADKVCTNGQATTVYSNWVFTDDSNTAHYAPLSVKVDSYGCLYGSSATGTSTDGYFFSVATPTQVTITASITTPSGIIFSNGSTRDTNGNTLTYFNAVYTDTTGNAVLTLAGGPPPSQVTFSYSNPIPGTSQVSLNYTSKTLQTNFGCAGINETTIPNFLLVTSIGLPDGSSYTITYEATPGFPNSVTGRIHSIQLPTGGTVTYNYTGGSQGINCSDGTTAGFTKQTTDGTWTYSHSGSSTTVTDPAGNQTLYTFSNGFETQRLVYQGNPTTGTLLDTIVTCYNGNLTNCATGGSGVIAPITETDVYNTLPNVSASRLTTFYSFALPTEVKEYDFGGTTPLRDTVIVYGSWNGTSCVAVGNNISDRPCSVTVTPAGTGTPKAQILFTYDSAGHATQVKRLVSGTSVFLTSNATYFSNGTLHTATDPKGTVTTYTNGACNGAFPTSISAGGLSTQFSWDCDGAVATSSTDANSKQTMFPHADPFWRVSSITDPLSNITNIGYTSTSVERSLLFGSSVAGASTTVDTYGRPMSIQTRKSPTGNYDTVSHFYDSNGRLATATIPCIKAKGLNCGTSPATTYTYDALNRPLVITSPINGTVTNTYTKQDVLTIIGPAPAGETTKQRQYEYDGLGRLKSVCEITSDAGSGPCGQVVAATGFLTSYTYDTLGRLTDVSQSGQARHFVFDDLGRMTSETQPESGTTTYAYDSATGCNASTGDLVKKTDAVGNVSCYNYDALHRVTSTTYSGPYAANTPTKTFVYDAATVNGTPMVNVAGRLAEAYTGVHTYDLGFSYSARGETTDLYENTPHSGSWYHTTASYLANGALNVLGGVPGNSAWTFGVDTKGRYNSVVYGAATNLVTAAVYNSRDEPTSVTLGSGDSDSFTYGTSGLMTKYQASIGATPQLVSGTLTRNANGSVKTLVVADPFNSGDVQTCNYLHDKLGRLTSAQCGTPWAQTFSYDALGNITQSGSISFQPTYSNNRISSLPGCNPPTLAYDANGNLLNDCTHNYTWDADGHMLSIDSTTNTYDALGRLAETNIAGTIKEILYSPIGKLGNMSGQTANRLFIPLVGGVKALYFGGVQYYTHPDWLGSTRFISTTSRTMYDDVAFSPFGKDYANSGNKTLDFTGQQQESFSLFSGDTFDFPFRKFSTSQGRWLSPDPVGDVSVSDPQSWDLYAYVRNRPLTLIDPLGLGCSFSWDPNAPSPGDPGGYVLNCWPDGGLGYGGGSFWQSHTHINTSLHSVNGWSRLQDLEHIVMVYDGTKQPIYNIATSAALFNVGALLLIGPWVLAPEVCVGSGGLACGAYIYGAVHVSVGGIVLLYGGYQFTRDVTIPSIRPQH